AHGAERRQMRVSKLRGVRIHSGYHDYAIRTGGLEIFPRIRFGREPVPPPGGRLGSGLPELDALIGGGIPRGTSVLIAGAPGTGKSVLTTQYAIAAAARGEQAAIFMFDERVRTFLERAAALDMSVAEHVEAGRLVLRRL